MIKYTTLDIIKRAEQLADLQNSDFISEYEKLALLNENFQILYQRIVNAGDKTWIKSKRVGHNSLLPSDFYQLNALYTNISKVQIPRQNASQLNGYQIRNNRLYLSEGYRGLEVVMEYWPCCPDLHIKTVEETQYPSDAVAIDGNLYVTKDSSGNYFINDLRDSSRTAQLDPLARTYFSTVSDCALFKDGFYECGYYSARESYSGLLMPLKRSSTNPTTAVIYNGELCYLSGLEVRKYKNRRLVMTLPEDTLSSATMIIYCNDNYMYQFTRDGNYIINGDSIKELPGVPNLKMYMAGNSVYAIINGELYKINKDGYTLIELENTPTMLIDEVTALAKDSFSGELFNESIFDDTLLEYPNNLYYTLLSYMLAMSFKIKQNGDITLLQNTYANAEAQFFDSLSSDSNEMYNIKNAYSQRRSLW